MKNTRKNTLISTLSKLLVLALAITALTACGSKTKPAETSAEMPNPVKEVTQEEVLSITGVDLKPFDGAEDVTFSVIDDKIAEMDFTYNGKQYFYRVEPTQEVEAYDLSGCYYDWKEESDVKVDYCDAHYQSCDEAAVLYWMDLAPGIDYTLACTSNASADEMLEVAEQCFTPAQGNN